MSGLRCFGSSEGSGSDDILEFDPVSRIIVSASCRIVISLGLPRLIGPVMEESV